MSTTTQRIEGVNTYFVNPDHRTIISDQWVEGLVQLGATRVRVDLRADALNIFPHDLYIQAAQRLAKHKIAMVGVFSQDINRPWLEKPNPRLYYPNQALGYNGNKRQNQYIKDTCVRAARVARELVPYGMTQFAVVNEPNLQGSIKIGANVPPVSGNDSAAVAPEAWASLSFELEGYLRQAGATHVELGALSWLATSGMDDHNPYCAGFMRRGLSYLRSTGVTRAPWDSVSVNAEGTIWTPALAARMANAIDKAVYDTLEWQSPAIVIGEYGNRNDAQTPAGLVVVHDALTTIASQLYFETHPCRTPHNLGDYALEDWMETDAMYLTGKPAANYSTVQGFLLKNS